MKSAPLLFGLFGLACLAAGWQLGSRFAPTEALPEPESSTRDADRAALEARITQLENALAAQTSRHSGFDSLAEPAEALLPADAEQARPVMRSSIPELDALLAAQIPLATAEAIRAQIGQNRLAMLSLRDRAEREGWINSARYAEELRGLLDPTQGIRERFGDDIYDRYLYASEKPNRVLATAVYPDSTASSFGLQPGDVVLSYAGTTIYSMEDLKQATVAGVAGESVLVTLQRDGVSFSITLPRGPLGIELKMESWVPE